MNPAAARKTIGRLWDDSILPALCDYVRIPCKSPAFDAEWEARGELERALELAAGWCRALPLPGIAVDIVRLPGFAPLMVVEVPGDESRPVLCYGHLDKQPEMEGWSESGPWQPSVRDGKLYGRGAADDGYALFSFLAALVALHEQGVAHGRVLVLIEMCEESGSAGLAEYIGHLAPRIGAPQLVLVLDAGCGNYEQFWCTTSLRGLTGGNLTVRVLCAGVHSGDAGGIVPSTFHITRRLLQRLEDEAGAVRGDAFHVPIPEQRAAEAAQAAAVLGNDVHAKFPFAAGAGPLGHDPAQLILNRTWRPALEITGAEGLPPIADAGNVLRPFTRCKLSLRLPPTCDSAAAGAALKHLLEHEPPYGAEVGFEPELAADGWDAPRHPGWLRDSLERNSREFFGKPAVFMGEGGSIPLMAMLGARFPEAKFVVGGVLGPHSNAHGPDEFLHLDMAAKVTACIAGVLADQEAA